jgi:hypothetical protein
LVPHHLNEIVPNIRKKPQHIIPGILMIIHFQDADIEVFKKSFIPDTVKKWNCLHSELRAIDK